MAPVTQTTREIVAKQLGETTAAEEALARAHEFLAETLRAKAEMMAQMGHEIRTPLNGIVGTTELLLGTGLSDEQREYASATMTSATALMVVINDVLDFSMLEAGSLELDVGTFEVRHLVDGLSLSAPAHARERGVKLSSEFSGDVPVAVSGDGNRIRHVLTKLVTSALSHSDGGDVTVRVDATNHGTKRLLLQFDVTDAGSELKGESLESLFDIYAYAKGSTLADDRTTGVGLTVCKQLVELMGGEIGVQSAPGEGTTYWFTTPVGIDGAMPYPEERVREARRPARSSAPSQDSAPARNGRAKPKVSAGTMRILIADDDRVSQLVLTRQLEARGYSVDVASNGREAVELHAKGSYDAIFMDCQMPELNGFEATVAIREHEGDERHTPIVAMTASAREADREQCFVSGMDDYVPKPLDQTSLDAALARRMPVFDSEAPDAQGGKGKSRSPKPASLPLLENSLLADVFRHNSESRGYLIGVFIEESRGRIEQIALAEQTGDAAAMQRLAHALKGSARTIGARRLEEVSEAVQEAALEGRIADGAKLQGTLEQCFELTAELLRKGCPEAQDAELARH
jgi:CheY-like chemotaxis protein/nitrogen-specific signal transduction histidine kinase